MPVLVESDPLRAGEQVAALPAGTAVVSSVAEVGSWLATNPDEYVVVLGPEVDQTEATTLADKLRLSHPAVALVLVRPRLTAAVLSGAMEAGFRAVLARADLEGLSSAAERARQQWEALHGPVPGSATGGTVITVFSPKGGVGKTTTAVNLALALHGGPTRVCVLDLDLAFGDVAITLQLIPEHTIDEAVVVEDHLDFSMLQTLLTPHATGLVVLAAPVAPDAKDRISAGLVRRVVGILRAQFDYVVIDTSPGFDEHVLAAFDETDECLLVTTLDVPTVKNVKVALETLDVLRLVPGRRHLVLNRADDEVGLSTANIEGILGRAISVTVPTALAVATATNHGRPIVLSRPDHPVSAAVRSLAALVADEPETPERATRSRRGLFGRRKKEAVG